MASPAPRHVHILGIGGVGMSAVALLARHANARVTGSDLRPSPITRRMQEAGCTLRMQPWPDMAAQADWLVLPNSAPHDHPERIAAQASSTRLLSRDQAIAHLTAHAAPPHITVLGRHRRGLTTFIASQLTRGGHVCGALPRNGEPHARLASPLFLEADESQLTAPPPHAIIAEILPELSLEPAIFTRIDRIEPTPTGLELDLTTHSPDHHLTHTVSLTRNPGGSWTVDNTLLVLPSSPRSAVAHVVAITHLTHHLALPIETLAERLESTREGVIGHFDLHAHTPPLVHEIFTTARDVRFALREMGWLSPEPPIAIFKPYPFTFGRGDDAVNAYVRAFSTCRGVCVLPPYPGQTFDIEAALHTALERAHIPLIPLPDSRPQHPLIAFGGEDIAALCADLGALAP